MTEVNRHLEDPFYDDIDHALGRPKDPLQPSYRNYYAAPRGEPVELEMAASNKWEVVKQQIEGSLVIYAVTHQGRLALRHYLKQKGKL